MSHPILDFLFLVPAVADRSSLSQEMRDILLDGYPRSLVLFAFAIVRYPLRIPSTSDFSKG
jgi:hypothetical protein